MNSRASHKLGEPETILIVLPTWVGDFVMATPFLRQVRTRFPDARITFLAEPNLKDLIRGGDWMDEVEEWPAKAKRGLFKGPYRRLVSRLRRQRFDWAILLPNSFRSALLAWQAGARRRFGYDRDGRKLLLTDRLQPRNRRKAPDPRHNDHRKEGPFVPYPLVNYYDDLANFIGIGAAGDRFELATTDQGEASVEQHLDARGAAATRPLVVLSPGAKYGAAKCWPADRFAAVSDRLIESYGAVVAVTCGPGEEPIARAIAEQMQQTAIVFDDPRLNLDELKALIRRADLLICNDAGPRHFAKAFDVPVLTVFGPTHPEWTRTSHEAERVVRIDIDCGPCQQRICPLGHLECMKGVTVEMVFDAAVELLVAYRGVSRSGCPTGVRP